MARNTQKTTDKPAAIAYETELGTLHIEQVETFLDSKVGQDLKGKVDLLFTSPPFPLVSPKRYGNQTGDEYREWMIGLATRFAELLSPTGSMVIEIGNAWERGQPLMSTVPLETLIGIARVADLNVCQQFVCHNPARLPSPAAWVTVRRIRVKDSFTHVWWYSRTEYPKADNKRVLRPYKNGMKRLLSRGSYNSGTRPSEHAIGDTSFLSDHGGSIPPSMLEYSNTGTQREYAAWCAANELTLHPARMPPGLVEFFVSFLTDEGDLVFDPFAGSNTTGSVAEKMLRRWCGVESNPDYAIGSMGRSKVMCAFFSAEDSICLILSRVRL